MEYSEIKNVTIFDGNSLFIITLTYMKWVVLLITDDIVVIKLCLVGRFNQKLQIINDYIHVNQHALYIIATYIVN